MVEILLNHGAQIDARRDDGMTALSLLSSKVATKGDFDALCALLERDASVNVTDKSGRTPLQHMCDRLKSIKIWKNDDMRSCLRAGHRLLEAGPDANLQDRQNASPIHYAFQAWNSGKNRLDNTCNEFLRTLLKYGNSTEPSVINFKGKQLLTSAIEARNEDLIMDPLLANCSVDKRDHDQNGYNAIEQACISGCSEELLLHMLKHSSNPTILSQVYKGLALLHRAALAGHTQLIKTLLDAGAAIDDCTTEQTYEFGVGSTALMLAIGERMNASMDVLLDSLASTTALDDNGWIALHYAANEGNLEALDHLQLDNFPTEAGVMFNKNKVYLGTFGNVSPFYLAASGGHYQIMERLMSMFPKLDINHGAQFNITALHWACDRGHLHIVKLLLSSSVCVNVIDAYGGTPLHVSVRGNNKDIALLLLEHGADTRMCMLDGMCPKMLAICNGHLDLANVIGEYEAKLSMGNQRCLYNAG